MGDGLLPLQCGGKLGRAGRVARGHTGRGVCEGLGEAMQLGVAGVSSLAAIGTTPAQSWGTGATCLGRGTHAEAHVPVSQA